jgi:hypothetical protein
MSGRLERLEATLAALRELVKAERDSAKQCARNGALSVGATRARKTSANARWSVLAEHRDRVEARFVSQLAECGYVDSQDAKALTETNARMHGRGTV